MRIVSNRTTSRVGALISVVFAILTLGCTTVKTEEQYSGGPLPKPDRFLVYPFAYSPSQVRLDRGLTPEIERSIRAAPAPPLSWRRAPGSPAWWRITW